MIKRFDEHSSATPLKKVWYVNIEDLRQYAPDDVEKFINDNNHNNGHAFNWYVDTEDSAYPQIDQYFVSQGIEVGEKVLVHSTW